MRIVDGDVVWGALRTVGIRLKDWDYPHAIRYADDEIADINDRYSVTWRDWEGHGESLLAAANDLWDNMLATRNLIDSYLQCKEAAPPEFCF